MKSESDWTSNDATDEIREIAKSKKLSISYKKHAMERLGERGLIVSDVLYVLKNGFIYVDATPSTREGYNKYRMESRSPNSGSRTIGVVVIPDKKSCTLKIISVMWIDEKETRSGSILGEDDE